MEIFSTEEQQEEAIKQFLKDNALSLALGALFGLGGIFGWNSYSESKLNTISEHSMAFSALSEQTAEPAALLAAGEQFTSERSDSNYAALTNLLLAKAAVEEKQLSKAADFLNAALAGELDPAVKSVALLRLARIELSQSQYDAALATLNKLNDESFEPLRQELKGDVHLAKGDKSQARSAYQAAADASGLTVDPNLQMKLDDLTPAV